MTKTYFKNPLILCITLIGLAFAVLISNHAGAETMAKKTTKNASLGEEVVKKVKTTKTKTTKTKEVAPKKNKEVKLAAAENENILVLTIEGGDVEIELRPDLAPNHVARIKQLAKEGFYDGVVFHRVIAGFMAQTGDPTGTGSGGSPYPDLRSEFSNQPHLRGTVSMARTNDPHSANSQFFIVFEPSSWLDGQYTVWGQVISGMEFVDALPKGAGQSGMVAKPGKIIKAKLISKALKG